MPEWWTKRSLPPSSGVMKPKPFSSLNHFTVPVAMLIVSSTRYVCCERGGADEATCGRCALLVAGFLDPALTTRSLLTNRTEMKRAREPSGPVSRTHGLGIPRMHRRSPAGNIVANGFSDLFPLRFGQLRHDADLRDPHGRGAPARAPAGGHVAARDRRGREPALRRGRARAEPRRRGDRPRRVPSHDVRRQRPGADRDGLQAGRALSAST